MNSPPPQYWAVGPLGVEPRITAQMHRTAVAAYRELYGRRRDRRRYAGATDPHGIWAKPLGTHPDATDVHAIEGWAPVLPAR